MKVTTVVGARPQFVKAAVVSRAIKLYNEKQQNSVSEVIVHTGQHYDNNMSDLFFQEMHIPAPDYFLGIGGSSHGKMTGQMLEKIEEILQKEKPDVVLVYGDTNSTLAGALAAAKLHIPVAHVEAGLRSFNMAMPEEINRILTDRISRWLFCPTAQATRNLEQEGVRCWPNGAGKGMPPQVCNSGDVMYDAALYYAERATGSDKVRRLVEKSREGFYLATIHRAENTDDPMRLSSIFRALGAISRKVPVLLPVHPRTGKILAGLGITAADIELMEPVGYLDMLYLLKNCRAVFTDSGGVQKEAYFFEKPCVTLRDETEWTELVENGFNVLAGADYEEIIRTETGFVRSKPDFSRRLYGAGNAGAMIIETLLDSHAQSETLA